MSKTSRNFLIAGCVILVAIIIFAITPAGVKFFNNWGHSLQKTDDSTNYETLKVVEDTARAMISSYKSDKLTYETYIASEDKEEQSWAKQAKIRANTTANSYNEYILKNSYVWKDNIPEDIDKELPLIE